MGLATLATEAAACHACSARGNLKALSEANGPVPCEVMLIGEAPGRLGAGRTGIPFTLDVSARRLELLMAAAGLRRENVFVTNALLCAPLSERGLNRSPRASELKACSGWLRRQIEVVDPALVVAMGAVALRALGMIEPHGVTLGDVGRIVPWQGRSLMAVYHPGARSAVHRPWQDQVQDWRVLGQWIPTGVWTGLRPVLS